MVSKQTPELVRHMLRELEAPARRLTNWELGFLESITDQFDRLGRLTDTQFEKLESIYAEKTA